MQRTLRWLVAPVVAALALVGAGATAALAAVTGTLNAATLASPNGSDFTWSCDVNPGGSTVWVMGRSWNDPTNGVPGVDTPRQQLTGSITQRLAFSRDGVENQRYGYRCLWYSSATTTTVLGKTADAFFITTSYDNDPPVARLTGPSSAVEDTSLTFDASTSTDPDNDIARYSWNFGDGATGSGVTAGHTYAEPGTFVVTVTVTDAGNLSSSASRSVTIADSSLFGSNVDATTKVSCAAGSAGCDPVTLTRDETFAEALARQDAEYAPKVLRLFNTGLPSTTCTAQKNSQPRVTVQSFKADPALFAAGNYDATVNAWLACFTRQTYVTFYHEPEDNWTTATQKANYRAALVHLSGLVLAHPNRANLVRTIIYGDFTWDATSGRNAADWYPGDAYIDAIGADMYSFKEENTSATDNETMATHQVRRPSLAWARSHGKPFLVPELGYDDPATREAFLRDAGAWARANDVRIVCYFDSIGGLGDHRLRDAASQVAWHDVVAG